MVAAIPVGCSLDLAADERTAAVLLALGTLGGVAAEVALVSAQAD